MMNIKEMRARKKELGYTNKMLAERSGVPLGTVQKVLSGATANPRRDTLEALDLALKEPLPLKYRYDTSAYFSEVREGMSEYYANSSGSDESVERVEAKKINVWNTEAEPSERWPHQGHYTIEDYYAIPDETRVELIDGVIYDMSSPTAGHQLILGALFVQFYSCIEEHSADCEVFFAPMDVRLDMDNRTMVQPDLLISCRPDAWNRDDRYEGAPDMVVEVLSPSTKSKDCTIKLQKYMYAGVKEYWIVDTDNKKVMVYCFEDDVLPTQYSFDDMIPIGISDGKCSIDFSVINEKLKKHGFNR